MTTEEITLVIQTLQDQLKEKQDIESELRHEIDLQIKQQKDLSNDNEYLRQTLAAIQLDNSNHNNTRARLETQLYAQEQEMMTMKKEIQQLSKWKRDAEKKLDAETQSYETEKAFWQQKEADLYNQIRNLSIQNNNLGGEPRTPRTPRRRSSINLSSTGLSPFYSNGLGDIDENSTTERGHNSHGNELLGTEEEYDKTNSRPTPKLAVIDSSYMRESKIAQRTIKAQDKLILELKTELEKKKALLQEQQKETQLQSLKVVHLEHEIASVKQLNRSLMEDNESYQILLHEKTMNGEFMMNPIMQVDNNNTDVKGSKRNSLAMKESVSSSSSNSGGGGLNLAAELASSIPEWNSKKEAESDKTIQELNDEIKTLQDTNRALQLYMNKILMKIINNKQLVDVLSIDQPTSKSNKAATDDGGAAQIGEQNKKDSSSFGGPVPAATVSTAAHTSTMPKSNPHNNNSSNNRHRRRTISYWGSKAPSPPPAPAIEDGDSKDQKGQQGKLAPQPERSVSTATHNNGNGGSGWAKALRRMSGLAWASSSAISVKEESPTTTNTMLNNDSAVDSFGEEETEKSLEKARKQSGSSTPSVSSYRPSNDLGTLDEE